MKRQTYQEPIDFEKEEVEVLLHTDDPEKLLYVPIGVSMNSLDFEWAQSICIRLATHPHFNVRGNAILGFGHLARRFRRLDEQVRPLVRAGLRDEDGYVRGQADTAAKDIKQFLGWRLHRP
jgi:hypothetical protein